MLDFCESNGLTYILLSAVGYTAMPLLVGSLSGASL